MKMNIKYFFSKFLYYIQISSTRDCTIEKTARIMPRSNLVKVRLGRYSYVGHNNSICDTDIGSFCSIGGYCAIGGGVHPLSFVSTSPVFYDPNNCFHQSKLLIPEIEQYNQPKTIIGNDVWIGESVFIKAGIVIGDGAVVGAHSVVTHDVPPYAIIAGVPAKIIRYRFPKEIIQKLLAIKWWNWSEEELLDKKGYMKDPIKLISKF